METEATATEFQSLLESRGVTRRSFMKLCGAIAAAAGLARQFGLKARRARDVPSRLRRLTRRIRRLSSSKCFP